MPYTSWRATERRPDEVQREYGDLVKEGARRRGQSWEAIAVAVQIPVSSLRQIKSGRRRPNAEQHQRLAAYFEERRLQEVYERLGARSRASSSEDGLYADWVGRWYEVVEVGDVQWERRRVPRAIRTVDEVLLTHVGGGSVRGTLKRIQGMEHELGAVWDMEGRVLVGDGSLLLLYEEQRRTLPTASRGVIAVKHANGRTDHLHGVYAKYDYNVQLFVPRPLDWYRDKHRALAGTASDEVRGTESRLSPGR